MNWFEDGMKKRKQGDLRKKQEEEARRQRSILNQKTQAQKIELAKQSLRPELLRLQQLVDGIVRSTSLKCETSSEIRSWNNKSWNNPKGQVIVGAIVKAEFYEMAHIIFRREKREFLTLNLSVHVGLTDNGFSQPSYYLNYRIESSLGYTSIKGKSYPATTHIFSDVSTADWNKFQEAILDKWYEREKIFYGGKSREIGKKRRKSLESIAWTVFAILIVGWVLFVFSGQVSNDDLVRWHGSEYYNWLARQSPMTKSQHLMGLEWGFLCIPPIILFFIGALVLDLIEKIIRTASPR